MNKSPNYPASSYKAHGEYQVNVVKPRNACIYGAVCDLSSTIIFSRWKAAWACLADDICTMRVSSIQSILLETPASSYVTVRLDQPSIVCMSSPMLFASTPSSFRHSSCYLTTLFPTRPYVISPSTKDLNRLRLGRAKTHTARDSSAYSKLSSINTIPRLVPRSASIRDRYRSFTTTRSLNMASDEDYMAFLDKANKDPNEGYAKPASSSGAKLEFRATDHGVQVPAALKEVVQDAFYVSDADEPFVPVALNWDEGGKGLPNEGTLIMRVDITCVEQALLLYSRRVILTS